jgi:hypothetical protein
VKAILLVPSDAFRVALLADGPCGARVPRLVWMPVMRFETDETAPLGGYAHPTDDGSWEEWDDSDDWQRVADKVALVLAWDGAVVREGRDRAAYVLAEAFDGLAPEHPPFFRCDETFGWTLTVPREGGSTSAGVNAMLRGKVVPDDLTEALYVPWALAVCCAARGLGTVVVVGASHG